MPLSRAMAAFGARSGLRCERFGSIEPLQLVYAEIRLDWEIALEQRSAGATAMSLTAVWPVNRKLFGDSSALHCETVGWIGLLEVPQPGTPACGGRSGPRCETVGSIDPLLVP
jgi:hypothetical protein